MSIDEAVFKQVGNKIAHYSVKNPRRYVQSTARPAERDGREQPDESGCLEQSGNCLLVRQAAKRKDKRCLT